MVYRSETRNLQGFRKNPVLSLCTTCQTNNLQDFCGLLLRRGEESGRNYTVFTDSTAAMARLISDAPRPGQEIAIGIIDLAQAVVDQGNTITVRWTPAQRGVEGDEQADQRAEEAAALPLPRRATRHYSLAPLRRRATEQATSSWRHEMESRNDGHRAFRLPTAASRPGIRPQLWRATKRVAARFQLLSGHAMIAPS